MTDLFCNLNAISPDERDRHGQRWQQALGQLQRADELSDGWTLVFPLDNALLVTLAHIIADERLCCPFLSFQLTLTPDAETLHLSLTGPHGTRDLLAHELGLQG